MRPLLPLSRPLWRAIQNVALLLGASLAAQPGHSQTPPPPASTTAPAGSLQGTAWAHSPESLAASLAQATLVLPERATGGARYSGRFDRRPATRGEAVPVVLFLHGSSGLGLAAIGVWQQWLADLGVASLAPDSFALPGRVTYQSPIAAADYERIHALRLSEIAPALAALREQPWADPQRLVLAGTSEGAVAVARHSGEGFAARLLFSWSCEPNYFVQGPRNAFVPTQPVLNLISASDPYFSPANPWLGLAGAQGHCAAALQGHPRSAVLLIPGAPHTVLNWPGAHDAVAGFLLRVLQPPPRP